jgi:phytoene dehydrogenase-like protein
MACNLLACVIVLPAEEPVMRNHTRKLDVAIVGGGLAGLTAAALLARDGQRVALFERSEGLGGRAVTHVVNGFHLNLGPHAWYTGGPGTKVLGSLGIAIPGRTPQPRGAFALYGDRLHTLPIGFISLLTTDLLGLHGKLEAARLLASVTRMETSQFRSMTIGAWLDEHFTDPRTRDVVHMFIRVASYAHAPRLLSADAALYAFQTVLQQNVQYLDGGWQSLLDQLSSKARQHGAEIMQGSPVAEVLHDEAVTGVRLERGDLVHASKVVLAVPPAVATRLVHHAPPAITSRWDGVPSRAACLDLGLARLPKPVNTVAFGVDQPLYYSVHSATAAVAPAGSAMVHVAKYLDPSEPHDARATEHELEAFMDRLQPVWRREVVVRRYLPSMTVSHMIPTVASGGLQGRMPVEVREVPGLYLAGDWVGAQGTLANAAVASAAFAARLIVSRARPAVAGAVA